MAFSAALRFLSVLGLSCLVAGCFGPHAPLLVDETKVARTGITDGDAIAFLLTGLNDPQAQSGQALELERILDSCLQQEIKIHRPALTFIPPINFRQSLQLSSTVESEPPDPEILLKTILGRVSAYESSARLRYVIQLSGSSVSSDPRWSGGAGLGVAIAREKDVVIQIKATVLDIPRQRVAGSVRAVQTGRSGGGFVLVLFLIPIGGVNKPPQFHDELCADLGRALVRLISE